MTVLYKNVDGFISIVWIERNHMASFERISIAPDKEHGNEHQEQKQNSGSLFHNLLSKEYKELRRIQVLKTPVNLSRIGKNNGFQSTNPKNSNEVFTEKSKSVTLPLHAKVAQG